MIVRRQCILCVHYEGNNKCAAFDDIPQAIVRNEHDHREPYPNDNGIQYEPIDEEPANGINNDNGA